MEIVTKIGIIICDRYRRCTGGKCFRSLKDKEGAFSVYTEADLELVGYTTCDGCPGGNVEYAGAELIKNGAEVIHLATGLVVGYPPCPYIKQFCEFIPEKYSIIPKKRSASILALMPSNRNFFLYSKLLMKGANIN